MCVYQGRIQDFRKGGLVKYVNKVPSAPLNKQGAKGAVGEGCGEWRSPHTTKGSVGAS